MGATGTATINFGAFPGSGDASVAVTGQTAILAGSLVEAWVYPTATSDHSVDEHLIDPPRVIAGNVSAGVGFTIYGFPRNDPKPQDQTLWNEVPQNDTSEKLDIPYGQWTVAWVWN